MKRMIKILALLLSAVTLLSVMCIPAFAYSYPMAVTIYYKDEAGNQVSPSISMSINAADTVKPTWSSPTVSGYARKNDSDATVTYDMLNKSFPPSNYVRNGSGTYTVVYVKLYTHTVRYVNANTGASIGSCTVEGKTGQGYSVTAPSVTGMTPTKSTITGSFGSGDTSETVYSYSTADDEYRTLQYANGGYRFHENADADDNERLHFIPVYVQNGDYIVSVTVTQVWTPAGMITAVRNSTPITVDGTVYDDFYLG